MNHVSNIYATCLAVALACSLPAQATGFCDGFEGATLNSFWTATASSGSISLSTVQVHGGMQAARFDSVNTPGVNKGMQLTHLFAQPTYGRVSVWVYDTGANYSSSNYIGMWTGQIGIFTFDYNLGPTNGGSYTYNLPGGVTIHSGIPRTQAWHEFVIETTPMSLTLAIDGTTIYSAAGNNPMSDVRLYMGGPSWRPAWTSYFDDFCFSEGSYQLFGSGCAGSNGTPALGAPTSGPFVGSNFDVTVSSLPVLSAPFGMFGTSNTVLSGGGALPLPLDFLGMTGCTLFVSPDFIDYLGNRPTPSTAVWRLTIPNNTAFAGLDFYQQVLVLDPGINAFNAVVSNAGHGTIE